MSINNSRIPKVEMFNNQNLQPQLQVLQQVQAQPAPGQGLLPSAKDEDKMPLFLIKLWNIVDDPTYQQIIRWDDSGYSFHILDPYSFCRNVLPHYFKHNNLNSLIRQLNMYGFRKMSPLDKGGLTRSESDQDHLEFSHASFIRDRPDLLVNIKRKLQQSTRATDNSNITTQTHNSLQIVMEELRQLREKQRSMDNKMHELTKENETLWEQMDHVRTQHNRQQQVVTKLVQFLVAMVQPNLSKRVLKRGVLAIDEPPNKRPRTNQQASSNLTDILDRLQRELTDNGGFQQQNYNQANKGPIIADVTDEFGGYVASPDQMSNRPYSTSPNVNSPTSRTTTQPRRKSQPTAAPQPAQQQQQQQQQHAYQPMNAMPSTTNAVSLSTMQQPCSSNQSQMNAAPQSPFGHGISMTPALERQISQELQEYLNGVDMNIDSCRDLLSGQWDFDFLENLANDDSITENKPSLMTSQRLALEQGPVMDHNVDDIDPFPGTPELAPQAMDHFVGDLEHPALNYPSTPELLTPCTSPQH